MFGMLRNYTSFFEEIFPDFNSNKRYYLEILTEMISKIKPQNMTLSLYMAYEFLAGS